MAALTRVVIYNKMKAEYRIIEKATSGGACPGRTGGAMTGLESCRGGFSRKGGSSVKKFTREQIWMAVVLATLAVFVGSTIALFILVDAYVWFYWFTPLLLFIVSSLALLLEIYLYFRK